MYMDFPKPSAIQPTEPHLARKFPTISKPEHPPSENENEDKNLTLLLNQENGYLKRLENYDSENDFDGFMLLNDMYLKAKAQTASYLSQGGKIKGSVYYDSSAMECSVGEILENPYFATLSNAELKAIGIFPLGSGMFTNSICRLQSNVALAHEKMVKSKGLTKMGLIEAYKTLARTYNEFVGFNCYDLNII